MSTSSLLLIGSPIAFAPIAFEYTVASSIYIILLLKSNPNGNVLLLISSSVFKILASAAVLSTNLHPLGLANLPFLTFQLINEVTILVWTIQRREDVSATLISSLYRTPFKVLRVLGELCTILIICGTGVAAPFLDCPCRFTVTEIFSLYYALCNEHPSARTWSTILTPQIRGLAFAISLTAGAASINGLQAMLSGATSRIRGEENQGVEFMGRDFEWKRKVRGVFSGLTIIVAFLFLATYVLPGFRQCVNDSLLENSETINNVHMTYTLGAISSSLFNAMLAIGQMFTSDILFRSTSNVFADGQDDDNKSTSVESGGTAGSVLLVDS